MVKEEAKGEETVSKDTAEAVVAIAAEENHDDPKAIAESKVVEPPPSEKSPDGSVEREAVLARVETTKRSALIKAWEDNEKSKSQNKAEKKLSSISSWENTQKAAVGAELRKNEEDLEKKKAQYEEKMKNKVAMIHRAAEEKRAMTEAMRGQDIFKTEEKAEMYHTTGTAPKKSSSCFGS